MSKVRFQKVSGVSGEAVRGEFVDLARIKVYAFPTIQWKHANRKCTFVILQKHHFYFAKHCSGNAATDGRSELESRGS